MTRHDGLWQELRAFVAERLLGWALLVHHEATMEMVRRLMALEEAVRRTPE